MKQRFAMLTPNSYGKDRVGLAGADVSEPEEHLVPMIQAFNKKGDAPFLMRMGVPAEFEAVVAKRTDLPVFRGELNPIFQGTYSSRIELKAVDADHGAEARHGREAGRPGPVAGRHRSMRPRSGGPGSRCSSTRPTTWPPAS